jgi:hypothetical protein
MQGSNGREQPPQLQDILYVPASTNALAHLLRFSV